MPCSRPNHAKHVVRRKRCATTGRHTAKSLYCQENLCRRVRVPEISDTGGAQVDLPTSVLSFEVHTRKLSAQKKTCRPVQRVINRAGGHEGGVSRRRLCFRQIPHLSAAVAIVTCCGT